jgi:hypothetical protein
MKREKVNGRRGERVINLNLCLNQIPIIDLPCQLIIRTGIMKETQFKSQYMLHLPKNLAILQQSRVSGGGWFWPSPRLGGVFI